MALCSSAKQGRVCGDDLCQGNPDNTLCGFDESFYQECSFGLCSDDDDEDYFEYEDRDDEEQL